jgi:hypothetical protein
MNEIEKALKELEEELKWCNHDGKTLTKYDEERFNVIKQALLELKEIKEAKPSEALKKLNTIRHLEIGFDKNGKPITLNDTSGLKTIEKALLKAQEQKKALEIIKEKNVRIDSVKYYDLEEYNQIYENKLTQEEYDLLKEMLK